MKKKYIILVVACLLFVFILYQSQSVKRMYQTVVSEKLLNTEPAKNAIISENEIKRLPEPVQQYLRFAGVVGKPRVQNVRTVFEGKLKMDPKQDWTKVKIEQYNFYDKPARFSYIQGNKLGIPIRGLDSYDNGKGRMLIKLGSIIPVVDVKSKEMDMSAMVTFFADMCSTPATQIDAPVYWETINPLMVKATFEDKGNQASAVLFFNRNGELIKFVTDDRYYSPTGKTYQKIRWTARFQDYKEYNGVKVPTYVEGIWNFSEGDYVYAKLRLKEMEYNCKRFK